MTASETVRVEEAGAAAGRERAVEALRAGELVVAPTDTVYGLYADATSPEAVGRLAAARQSAQGAPPAVLLHNPHFVAGVVSEVSEAAERLMAAYWPGPLTLVFRPKDGIDWVLGPGAVAVAIRMPAEPLAIQMLHDVGPLACVAASRPGDPPPTTIAEARTRLGDLVRVYVDDGPRDGAISTVVDLTRGGAEVLREGAIAAEDIAVVASGELGWGEVPRHSEQENGASTPK